MHTTYTVKLNLSKFPQDADGPANGVTSQHAGLHRPSGKVGERKHVQAAVQSLKRDVRTVDCVLLCASERMVEKEV